MEKVSVRIHSLLPLWPAVLLSQNSDDRTIRVWDATSGRSESTLDGHANEVHGVTVSAQPMRRPTDSSVAD